jgi:hypothetical protein
MKRTGSLGYISLIEVANAIPSIRGIRISVRSKSIAAPFLIVHDQDCLACHEGSAFPLRRASACRRLALLVESPNEPRHGPAGLYRPNHCHARHTEQLLQRSSSGAAVL